MIAIGADHGGVELEAGAGRRAPRAGRTRCVDLGTDGTDSVDYPDYGRAVAERVARGEVGRAGS